jgi:hypothetical protein
MTSADLIVLACICPLDQPCHADILARLANGDDVG